MSSWSGYMFRHKFFASATPLHQVRRKIYLIIALVTGHLGRVGQLGVGEMKSYFQLQNYMDLSQRQHSLH